jgi:hypothetical protein
MSGHHPRGTRDLRGPAPGRDAACGPVEVPAGARGPRKTGQGDEHTEHTMWTGPARADTAKDAAA